ncbi:MAG TPA: glycine zipper 2TM domain-containing protein [Lysobacter sp.]
MKHLSAAVLALSMTAFAGAASAQQYPVYPADGYSRQGHYDYARVVRVTPVYDGRRYAASTGGERCTESRTYAGGYRDDRYDGYRDDRRYDGYGDGYRAPTQGGSTAATVIGGIVGAVVGSQVGGGSARYATSAIGTMVGSQVGKQIYDNAHRQQRVGRVVACDPVQVGGYGRDVASYDVVYEYAGRQYTTRTSYDPGNRIRVRVDVRPE